MIALVMLVKFVVHIAPLLRISAIMQRCRRASRQVTTSGKLKPEDVLTLKVQIGIALVSGLFSILTLVLTQILSG